MKEIENKKLKDIKGGGVSPWAIIGFASIFVFLSGVVDGYVRPLPCHK